MLPRKTVKLLQGISETFSAWPITKLPSFLCLHITAAVNLRYTVADPRTAWQETWMVLSLFDQKQYWIRKVLSTFSGGNRTYKLHCAYQPFRTTQQQNGKKRRHRWCCKLFLSFVKVSLSLFLFMFSLLAANLWWHCPAVLNSLPPTTTYSQLWV